MTYKLTKFNSVIREADGACIPFADGNTDYEEYKVWLAEGGVPTPVPPPTMEEIAALYVSNIQQYLDMKARERNYDGILSACTYATSSNPKFAAEGQACVNWRDAVWTSCYSMLAEVQAGTMPLPTEEELLLLLPQLTWPV